MKGRDFLVKVIRNSFGIELNWSEFLALGVHERCFEESGLFQLSSRTALYCFMRNYFGLDIINLGSWDVRVKRYGKVEDITYGMDLLGTPEFKEYCRRNVQRWMGERTLP